jgi:hypothetical protein
MRVFIAFAREGAQSKNVYILTVPETGLIAPIQ